MLPYENQRNLPTVLLIDDDLISREVMATVLTMSGYTVHTADCGAASLELLATGECAPDVILMDAQMPGLSGTQLLQELRSRTKASVYAISGSNASDEVVAAADGFLLKPFGPDALHRFLEEHGTHHTRAPKPLPSAPANPSSAEPVVNAETLAQLREMMPETAVKQIYAAIVADLYKRLAALQIALDNGDAAQVRRIGHSIKGGCGMAGALQAARLGEILESGLLESKGYHLDNSNSILNYLLDAAHALERMLEREFQA